MTDFNKNIYVTAAPVLPGISEIREALPVTPANDSGYDAFQG